MAIATDHHPTHRRRPSLEALKDGKRVKSINRGDVMWMLLLEAALALSLFVFIMWWTLGPVKRREDLEQAETVDADTRNASREGNP
jgi:hypothetical protein